MQAKTVYLSIAFTIFLILIVVSFYIGTQASKTVTITRPITTTQIVTTTLSTTQTTNTRLISEYFETTKPILYSAFDATLLASNAAYDFANYVISAREAEATYLRAATMLADQVAKLEKLRPPEELKSYHERLLTGLKLLQRGWQTAYDAMKYYPSDQYVELTQRATNYIKTATAELKAAKSEMDEFLSGLTQPSTSIVTITSIATATTIATYTTTSTSLETRTLTTITTSTSTAVTTFTSVITLTECP